MSVPPYGLTAKQALQAFHSGSLTVEDYAKSLIGRIEERQPVVKAWVHFRPDQVLEQARALDRVPKDKRGPLHGVSVAVKDVIYTKEMPTQHNSSIYKNDQPEVDAASIIMLKAAGALIVGKTKTTEFAAVTAGTDCTNPHDPERTPGGSSSGSGAAVGDFQAALGLGTQTGGSTIRPGSFNGIYAMKPTWNSISREGQKIYSLTLDTLGLYARSVEDLELLGSVFGLQDDEPPRPVSNGVRGLHFAFLKTMLWHELAGPGTQDAMSRGVELLRKHGAEVEEIHFSDDFAQISNFHSIVLFSEGRVAFRPDYKTSKDQLEASLVKTAENGHRLSRKQYLEAFDGAAALRPKWDAIADRYDAVIVPSVPDEAPKGLESTGSAKFNSIWTLLHVPVVNIPGFVGENGMPVGLSLVAARYKDQALLAVSKEVGKVWEGEGGWNLRVKK